MAGTSKKARASLYGHELLCSVIPRVQIESSSSDSETSALTLPSRPKNNTKHTPTTISRPSSRQTISQPSSSKSSSMFDKYGYTDKETITSHRIVEVSRKIIGSQHLNISEDEESNASDDLQGWDEEDQDELQQITPPAASKRSKKVAKLPKHTKVQKKKVKSKKTTQRHQKRSKKSVLEDAMSSSESMDEQYQVTRSKRYNDAPSPQALLQVLEKAHAILSQIGDIDEVEDFFHEHGIAELEGVQELQEYCAAIARILGSKVKGVSGDQVPSTIAMYSHEFVYRAPSNQLYHLIVADAIQGNVRMNTKKVYGFVRYRGVKLMGKLPGVVSCAEYHPKLLDNELWLAEVKRFGKFLNHEFKSSQFEQSRGWAQGDYYAGHCEPSLMLWFACFMVTKLLKVPADKDLRYKIGEIWKLRDVKGKPIEAEVVLTEYPCPDCSKFQQLIEQMTGIKFHIVRIPNLGRLEFVRNNQGYKYYPRTAIQEEPEDEFEQYQRQEYEEHQRQSISSLDSPRSGNRLAVVIQSKCINTSSKPSKPNSNKSHKPQGHSTSMVRVTKKPQARPPPTSVDDTDGSDYQPEKPRFQRSKAVGRTSNTSNHSPASGAMTQKKDTDDNRSKKRAGGTGLTTPPVAQKKAKGTHIRFGRDDD